MGKTKKSTPKKDNNQMKISSFFQAGGNSADTKSQLFTAVGGFKARSKLSLRKTKKDDGHDTCSVLNSKTKEMPVAMSTVEVGDKQSISAKLNTATSVLTKQVVEEPINAREKSVTMVTTKQVVEEPINAREKSVTMVTTKQPISNKMEASPPPPGAYFFAKKLSEKNSGEIVIPETQVQSPATYGDNYKDAAQLKQEKENSPKSPNELAKHVKTDVKFSIDRTQMITKTEEAATPEKGTDLLNSPDADVCIIPDTPDPAVPLKQNKKKLYCNQRSFLNPVPVKPDDHLPNGKKNVLSKKRATSRSSFSTRPRSLKPEGPKSLPSTTNWDAQNSTFCALMTQMGLDTQFSSPSLISGSDNSKSSLLCQQPNRHSSASKRPSSKGESPDPKRLSKYKVSPTREVDKCTRKLGLHLLEDPPRIGKVALSQKQKERKNTSFARKFQASFANRKAADGPKDVQLGRDEILSDILCELKEDGVSVEELRTTKQTCNENETSSSTGTLSQNDPIDPTITESLKDENVLTKNVESGIILSTESSLETDEILTDIMHELRDQYIKSSETAVTSGKKDVKSVEVSSCAQVKGQSLVKQDNGQLQIPSMSGSLDGVVPTEAVDVGLEVSMFDESIHETDNQGETTATKADAQYSNITTEKLSTDFQMLSPFKERKQRSCSQEGVRNMVTAAHSYGRHRVMKVTKNSSHETVLTLESYVDQTKKDCVLCGFWTDTRVQEGDIVHVVGNSDEAGTYQVTDKDGLLVVNPDLLISGTSVVSSINCMRRSVLNEKFKGCDSRNIYMLYGSIIHAFFQEVLSQGSFSKSAMMSTAKTVLQQNKFLHEMYGQDISEQTVQQEIEKYMSQTQQWADTYMQPAQFTFGNKLPSADTTITDIADIEENIWCPKYGIKGKIDLTVGVKIHDKKSGQKRKIMPLELKTGRASYSTEHQGQVTLYSMMSGERRQDPEGGLLLYLKEAAMKTIPADHTHKRGLVQLRNEMASYLHHSISLADDGSSQIRDLPRPISNQRWCTKCPHLLHCTAYLQSVEQFAPPSGHDMEALIPETLSHVTPAHLAYFAHWCRLVTMEAALDHKKSTAKDIWCKTGWQREESGECIADMILADSGHSDTVMANGYYTQTFVRLPSSCSKKKLTEIGLSERDSIVVSAENRHLLALSLGSIFSINESSVVLMMDRDLRRDPRHKDLVFRLDKCDVFNSMASNYTNLSRLLQNEEKSTKLRAIVIEKKKPEFEPTMSKGSVEKVKHIFKSLNKPQKMAILKVLMCRDYVLIKGYPGTGKTSTIVAMVQILQVLGYSVLLTSYTNSAVDNILLKLKEKKVDFVRLGNVRRVHPHLLPFSAEALTKHMTSVAQLAQFYNSKQVVATTCLGTNHVLFSRRKFDICIVDEASQVLQPSCLGPLFCSERFVLVGDPRQLPAVVQSKEARQSGMDESLFVRLDDTGATYELNLQYRMNSEIMRLSNELIYSGALQCGNETVAQATLHLPSPAALDKCAGWIQTTVGGNRNNAVVFLDTQQICAQSCTATDSGVTSEIEATLVTSLCATFKQGGVCMTDVGVIAPYRQQVGAVRKQLEQHNLEGVEVNTVDQYQGRDKEVILVSFVKQGQQGKASEILKDERRLNVALTRAKYKLILIGNTATLKSYGPLAKVMELLRPQQIVSLSQDMYEQCSLSLQEMSA